MKKTAFITGVTGQDGSFLSKLLLDKGYEVYGGIRRTSTLDTWRLDFLGITDQVKLVDFDLLEYSNIFQTIKELKPIEFYNLAAQSFVGISFKQPLLTADTDAIGVLRILDALKTLSPETRFYQASTSEMFGKVQEVPQKETTPFYPRSPYGVSKLFSHWMTLNYRESYNMFAVSGILFNHESELRGPEFVTRKVTINVAKRYKGFKEVLQIGNLDSQRDWGYAKEYVEGMYLMLQQKTPDTYILSTGETTTIRDFIETAFKVIDINIVWEGKGTNEKGYDKKTNELLIEVNPEFYRPAEVDLLIGDASKAKSILGWEAKTKFDKLAELMVKSDIDLLQR